MRRQISEVRFQIGWQITIAAIGVAVCFPVVSGLSRTVVQDKIPQPLPDGAFRIDGAFRVLFPFSGHWLTANWGSTYVAVSMA